MPHLKLMIAEDEEKSRKLLKILISEMQLGFAEMIEAENGKRALEILRSLEASDLPHVLLTDIRMPLMSGLELAEALQEEFPGIRMIVVTAYDEFEYARSAIRFGVKDFIVKPFNRAEMRRALEKITQSIADSEQEASLPLTLIEKIKEHVEKNLGCPTLSLTSAAEEYFINPSYLSRQFKKEMGLTFSDYLLNKRIEKACFYMENTDYKAYEIAEKVGIPDAKYFGKCFKKRTGKAFQEWKRHKE